MTNFVASPSTAVSPRRLLGASAALLASATLLCLGLTAPARAVVTTVAGTTVGLQPRNPGGYGTTAVEHESFSNESGAPVLHGTSVYAIYWDPTASYHHEWQTLVNGFFHRLGESSGALSNVYAALGQYRDRSNQPAGDHVVYRGSYTDTAKFPSAGCTDPHALTSGAQTCLTDAQLREQLQSFIASHGLPKGMGVVYYILTSPGVTVCVDAAAGSCSDYALTKTEEENEERKSASYKSSFCSYHADINPDGAVNGDANTILYAAIPWTAGTAGLFAYVPSAYVYSQSWDCQDGGISPINPAGERIATPEKPRELTKEEEEKLAKGTNSEKAEAELKRHLEGPHEQEPNQEQGIDEARDYSAGLADLIIGQIAEEQADVVTDPLLNAWHDTAGREVTDECRDVFGNTVGSQGGTIGGAVVANARTEAGTLSNTVLGGEQGELGSGDYYINNVISLSEGGGCVGGAALVPRFTSPNPVNAGDVVSFDGMESTVGLMKGAGFGPSGPPTPTYATFSWNFGDGTPEAKGFAPGAPLCETPWLSPCAASVLHSYQYGGTYNVRLTVTDVAGNTSVAEHQVVVVGPPPSSSGQGSSVASAGQVPAPLAAAAIVSRSLKKALRGGLVVRYSVSEKVAGRFEVLLGRSLAKRLHIPGPAAGALPQGTPAQVVIAKALIVTTKGGRSSISIRFSKRVAKQLAHLRSVSLMLRMVVRNASSSQPLTTVVLSRATLSH